MTTPLIFIELFVQLRSIMFNSLNSHDISFEFIINTTHYNRPMQEDSDFFMRYYIGHRGAYGHEFLDFQLDSTGKLKYHNNSEYKSDQLIRKQAYVSQTVIDEMRRIIVESGIMNASDEKWPKPDKIGKQQLVIRIGKKEVILATSKIGSYADVQKTADPQGLTTFFYLVQDLKCFVFSLVNLHFRIKPI